MPAGASAVTVGQTTTPVASAQPCTEDTNVSCAGRVSVTMTPTAVDGPPFVTTR